MFSQEYFKFSSPVEESWKGSTVRSNTLIYRFQNRKEHCVLLLPQVPMQEHTSWLEKETSLHIHSPLMQFVLVCACGRDEWWTFFFLSHNDGFLLFLWGEAQGKAKSSIMFKRRSCGWKWSSRRAASITTMRIYAGKCYQILLVAIFRK